MREKKVSNENMRDVKGGFRPFYAVVEEDGGVRIPEHSSTSCVKTYAYRECIPPNMFPACD